MVAYQFPRRTHRTSFVPYHIPAYRAMSGMVIAGIHGGEDNPADTRREHPFPTSVSRNQPAEAFLAWKEDVAKISAEDQGKAQLDQGECGEGYRFRSNRTPCFRRRRPHSRPSARRLLLRLIDVALLRLRAFVVTGTGIIANLSPAGFLLWALLAAGATIWLVLNNLGVCS